MLTNIQESNARTTPKALEGFERRWHLRLPESYRAFLLQQNGGRPVPAAFPISGMENNPLGSVQVFFGLNAIIKSSDLNWNLENLGVPQPAGLLPIACTEGADFVCIDTIHAGRVLFWDRMACWGQGKWSAKDFYQISENFDAFLSELHDAARPDESESDRVLRTGHADGLVCLLDSGYSLETVDDCGRTLIERAAIVGRPAMIRQLFERGAKLGKALQLAEQNLAFFPAHKETVDVLRELAKRACGK